MWLTYIKMCVRNLVFDFLIFTSPKFLGFNIREFFQLAILKENIAYINCVWHA